MRTYSFSRLQLFERCPAAFYYKYLLELPEGDQQALILGKIVHTAIDRYLSGDTLDHAVQTAVAGAPVPLDEREVYTLASHPTVMAIIGGSSEECFHLPLTPSGNITLLGYIDWSARDDTALHIIDWKTNRSPYDPTDNHQLGLYAWAMSQVTGVEEVYGELVFLRYPSSRQLYGHTYTHADMEDARQWAISLATRIEDLLTKLDAGTDGLSLFPDQPGMHCQHCGYAGLCVRSTKISPITVTDHAAAVKLATEVIRLESALGDYKESLKAWAKANGDIVVGDAAFSFVPSVSWGFSSEQLYDLCAELHDQGIDVFQYLSLTAANLKKIGVGDDRLSQFGKKKVTNTFRLMKQKEAS